MKTLNDRLRVFSAHAEVVPLGDPRARESWGILRARGGSSFVPDEKQEIIEYSPRTRR